MKMVERIKAAAARQGFTLAQLERSLGFGARTIYKWDKNLPSVDKVLAVANFLQVSFSWLVTGSCENDQQPMAARFELLSEADKEKIEHFMEISLIGNTGSSPAYINSAASEKNPSWVPVLGYVSSRSMTAGIHCLGYTQTSLGADYALIMDDSTMEPLFYPNEYVFLKNERLPADGDIVVANHAQRLMCRQYREKGNRCSLRPLNPAGPAVPEASGNETSENNGWTDPAIMAEIVGKVLLDRRQQDIVALFFAEKI